MRSMWPSASASPVSLAVITAPAGMPSVTVTVAVCWLGLPGTSFALPLPKNLTVPVSSPPIVAARVTKATVSFAEPVVNEMPAPLAPVVVKPENVKSDPARLASDIASEKVSSTVVLAFVCADTMAGPALSVATVPDPSTAIVPAFMSRKVVPMYRIEGMAELSGLPPSVRTRKNSASFAVDPVSMEATVYPATVNSPATTVASFMESENTRRILSILPL